MSGATVDVFVYPITILLDRYDGTYSHAKWTAWNLRPEQIPDGAQGGDYECDDFWAARRERLPLGATHRDWPAPWEHIIGLGNTPNEAEADLRKQRVERMLAEKP